MKTSAKNPFLLPALIASLGLMLAGHMTAQTFTPLHNFTALNNGTNDDGANSDVGLILSGNILYGAALGGGSSGRGTVFAVNTDGTGFTNLHSFTELSGAFLTNSDGASPNRLIISGNTLYGTAFGGGTSGWGTVFAVNTDGTGFTNLHNFSAILSGTNSDGAWPEAGLVLSGNILYGTAYRGGSSDRGTVFALNTDGTSFTNLHNFAATSGNIGGHGTNSDGAYPWADLILLGNTLYGTAQYGGDSGNGTVFKVNTNGTFTKLYFFTAMSGVSPYTTNSDGGKPVAGLVFSGGSLYGTTFQGGSAGNGTVFAINTNGTGFTNLHNFTAIPSSFPTTNSDGAGPQAGLVLSGNTLYGTAAGGGSSANGTVFKVNTDGTGFTTPYSFTASADNGNGFSTNSDGASPRGTLILSGHTLYGTAYRGGSSDKGTVFSLSLPLPQLSIIPIRANVILTWPTNAAGFTLQATTNLGSSAVWFTNLPGPVVLNGQNTVTNPISGQQHFYRLSQ